MASVEARGSALFLSGVVEVADRLGGGIEGSGSIYTIRGEDGCGYRCDDFTEIVTDGFRTLNVGNHVRFIPDREGTRRSARYILRVDEPPSEAYYATDVEIRTE